MNDICFLDRGIHYGDGLFETIAIFNNRPLCLDAHINRLLSACQKLNIDFDEQAVLESEIHRLCDANKQSSKRAALKIIITAGPGTRGYQRPQTTATRLLTLYSWPQYPQNYPDNGATIHLCTTRLGHNPRLSGIKHLNRLEQVLARNEWTDTNIREGLMLDIEDNVISGTMSNLFVINSNQKLLTPDISMCGIAGIVRQYILDYYDVKVLKLSLDDIYAADEIFFCNSIMGILSVANLAGHEFSLPSGSNKIKQILIDKEITAPS